MKKSVLVLLAAVMLAACSCTSEKKDKTDIPEETGTNEGLAEESFGQFEIKSLLAGDVIDARNGERIKLSLLDSDEDDETEPYLYCEQDLDGDGTSEFLVEFSKFGNTAIVHEYENTPYAYMIPFRSRLELKITGEMKWSSGADLSGTHRAVFTGNDMELVNHIESDFENDTHHIDGKEASFDEAMREWESFESTESAEWFFVYELAEE